MKRFIWIWLIALTFGSLLLGGKSHASILDLKIGPAQAFDVQYYWSHSSDTSTPDYNCYSDPSTCDRLNVSGLTTPYASAGSMQWTQPQLTSGQYYKFFNSATVPGTYGLAVYNADGSLAFVMHDTGDFYKLGADAIFYVGGGFFGTVITTTTGYNYGDSAVLDVGLGTPTSQDFANYTPPSSTVLAAGQTATSGGSNTSGGTSTSGGGTSSPPGPTVDGGTIATSNWSGSEVITSGGSSSAGITATQQSRVDVWTSNSQSYNNVLYINQVYGTDNNVTITQQGVKNRIDLNLEGNGNQVQNTQTGSNYLKEAIPGWGNNVIINQTNTTLTNYTETKIQGNGNSVNHTQTGPGNHLLFNTITGDINTVNTTQTGNAGHYAETKLTGNWNNVKVDQSGNTANKANIDVTNSGGAATVDLQQTGGKNFTIIQNCLNPAGCGTVIRQ